MTDQNEMPGVIYCGVIRTHSNGQKSYICDTNFNEGDKILHEQSSLLEAIEGMKRKPKPFIDGITFSSNEDVDYNSALDEVKRMIKER
jgi:hypothetical protein